MIGLSLDQIQRFVNDDVSLDEMQGMLLLRKVEIEQRVLTEMRRIRVIESRLKQIREQIKMLDAARDSLPTAKQRAKEDYIFLLLFEQRQGGIEFTAVALGAIYGFTLSVVERNPLHFMYGIIALLMMLANANHAGVPLLGHHPKVSQSGRNVGIVFTPFWLVVLILNGLAFVNTLG